MSNSWSDEELEASVIAYVAMLEKQRRGEKVVKSHVTRSWQKHLGEHPKPLSTEPKISLTFMLNRAGVGWKG